MMRDVAPAGRLVLDGALTMRNAEALCTTLRETICQHPDVSIDCTGAGDVDLSFIQLLIAARASALQADRTVALAARPAGALLDALTRGGFRITHDGPPGRGSQPGEGPPGEGPPGEGPPGEGPPGEGPPGEVDAFWFEGARHEKENPLRR